jgi:hypothetical protein
MHKLPSAQEVFDIVVNHLFTQGRPAYDGVQGCMYRTHDGLRCAVGVLIPDDLYDKAFENNQSNFVIQKLFDANLANWREHEDILIRLQIIHDNCPKTEKGTFNLAFLDTDLRNAAANFSLEYRRQTLAD